MDYKEKYEIALKHAKSLYNSMFVNNDILEQIFPELKESEDEKIRKEIISFLKEGKPYYCPNSVRRQEWANWLEKQDQGEQKIAWSENDEYLSNETTQHIEELIRIDKEKYCGVDVQYYQRDIDWIKSLKDRIQSTQDKLALEAIDEKSVNNDNKVEPKFKVGDWVVRNNIVAQILDIQEQYYIGQDVEGNDFTSSRFLSNKKIHLWSIKDAKDGDVLVDGDTPFIFKGLIDPHHPGQPVAYCGIDCENNFIVGSGSKGGTHWWCTKKKVKPATKEQRDLLFTKMKEAGYEWNRDKKELVYIKD